MNVHRERGCGCGRSIGTRTWRPTSSRRVGDGANDSTTHALLATCLLELKQGLEAEREAKTAVGCNPDDAYALYTLSRVHRSRPNYRGGAVFSGHRRGDSLGAARRRSPLPALPFFDTNRYHESLQTTEAALREDLSAARVAWPTSDYPLRWSLTGSRSRLRDRSRLGDRSGIRFGAVRPRAGLRYAKENDATRCVLSRAAAA